MSSWLITPVPVETDERPPHRPIARVVADSRGPLPIVAIIDPNGVGEHPVFGGRLVRYDATLANVGPDTHVLGENEDHGTAVASVAAGAGPCNGPAAALPVWGLRAAVAMDVVRALDFLGAQAASKNIRVAIMPFGVEAATPAAELSALASAIACARKAGIVCVASGGNTTQVPMLQPALDANVIAVGGYDDVDAADGPSETDRLDADSTLGPDPKQAKPDVLAIFDGWLCASLDPQRGTNRRSGTSFGCANVGGVIASLLAARPSLTADQMIDIVRSPDGCVKLDGVALNAQGYGAFSPNGVMRALGLI